MALYSHKRAAEDIKELARQLGASQIILGGHDWYVCPLKYIETGVNGIGEALLYLESPFGIPILLPIYFPSAPHIVHLQRSLGPSSSM